MEGLREEKKFDQHDAILAALDYIRHHGPPQNREKFAPENDGIFAIKSFQERIYGFFAGKCLFLCVAGVTKKKNRADQDLLNAVKGVKRRYEDQLKEETRRAEVAAGHTDKGKEKGRGKRK